MTQHDRWTFPDYDRYVSAGYWTTSRLIDIVTGHAASLDPGRPAVVDARMSLSYHELLDAARSAAVGLLSLGVKPGDVVSVKLPNWAEAALALLAAERIGAVINPLPITLGNHELEKNLGACRSRVLVTCGHFHRQDHALESEGLLDALPALAAVVSVTSTQSKRAVEWASLLADNADPDRGERLLAPLQFPTTAVSHLAFTSGSTGEPRGIFHTHNSLTSTVAAYIRGQAFDHRDVFHVPLPVGYSGGFVYGLRLGLQAGGTVVLQERWDPGQMLELVRVHRATYSTGTPTHFTDLVATGDRESLASLRSYNCGGAHVSADVVRASFDFMPRAFRRSYGMTECHRISTTDDSTPPELLLGSDGVIQPGMEVRVVDDGAQPVPPGEEGNVEVRGPFLFAGYLGGDAAGDAFRDGFYKTGDLGRVTAGGYLTITGKTKDVIVRGGAKIPVASVESMLLRHPSIDRVALIGVPDARLGERAVAYLTLKDTPGLSLEDIQRYLDENHVTKQYWPSEIRPVAELPLTPSGKVRKAVLREWAAGR